MVTETDDGTLSTKRLSLLVAVRLFMPIVMLIHSITVYKLSYKAADLLRISISNVYLVGCLAILIVPFFFWDKGSVAKSVIRNIFAKPGTPLVLLGLLPVAFIIANSIYIHKGITKIYNWGNSYASIVWATDSLRSLLTWLARHLQMILEDITWIWLKLLVLATCVRKRSILLASLITIGPLLINLADRQMMDLSMEQYGMNRYRLDLIHPAYYFWNILDGIAILWVMFSLVNGFRPNLMALTLFLVTEDLFRIFILSGGTWTYRAALGVPAILIWAILSRSRLTITPWNQMPPEDDEAPKRDETRTTTFS